MKKNLFPAAVAILTVFLLSSCKDIEEEGQKAGEEFCNCYDSTKDKDKCLDQLKKDYSLHYTSNKFIESFNESNPCSARLYKD
ncbi:MAG: hypothetical protein LBS09_00835 [Bacteroidales bacterium]|jgi:hypothetical protein|nr:hypothetical protein [Bacteroidales bacterium]